VVYFIPCGNSPSYPQDGMGGLRAGLDEVVKRKISACARNQPPILQSFVNHKLQLWLLQTDSTKYTVFMQYNWVKKR
jgi:hypothetical protein